VFVVSSTSQTLLAITAAATGVLQTVGTFRPVYRSYTSRIDNLFLLTLGKPTIQQAKMKLAYWDSAMLGQVSTGAPSSSAIGADATCWQPPAGIGRAADQATPRLGADPPGLMDFEQMLTWFESDPSLSGMGAMPLPAASTESPGGFSFSGLENPQGPGPLSTMSNGDSNFEAMTTETAAEMHIGRVNFGAFVPCSAGTEPFASTQPRGWQESDLLNLPPPHVMIPQHEIPPRQQQLIESTILEESSRNRSFWHLPKSQIQLNHPLPQPSAGARLPGGTGADLAEHETATAPKELYPDDSGVTMGVHVPSGNALLQPGASVAAVAAAAMGRISTAPLHSSQSGPELSSTHYPGIGINISTAPLDLLEKSVRKITP